MRRVPRKPLMEGVEKSLRREQKAMNKKKIEGNLDPNAEWKKARQTKPVKAVLETLKGMMGDHQRCMYCHDSHGTDIEHFRPKTLYPERMFSWLNMLLCCTECGRFKGSHFPLQNGTPLLIDPTTEEPWQYMDFDPDTGNLVACFDLSTNDYSPKGTNTVSVLQLDRREALAKGYRRTFLRLSKLISNALDQGTLSEDLCATLREADDHGLLGWCFIGAGRNVEPFKKLQQDYPTLWAKCQAAFVASEPMD